MIFQKNKPLKGELTIPGDKSISHRAVMFGSLADGCTEVTNFLQGADCLSTISCFRAMGIQIEGPEAGHDTIRVYGKGLHGLRKPDSILDVGNSGTTMRLMSGILTGQSFDTTVTGDASIQSRPMNRIITPLSMMKADIKSIPGNGCAPLTISSIHKPLSAIHYDSPVASAQVKSSILLAGLYADDKTSVSEPYLSRNHSELMLQSFGAKITSEGSTATIEPDPNLYGQKVVVPGDISSAAYFIAGALMIPGSEVYIKNVGINPTRDGMLRVCEAMGASIEKHNIHEASGELCCDLLVKYSSLHGTTIEGEIIPAMIDEIPMVAVLACFAEGTTVIKDAKELKVKESNRLDAMVENLSKMGADIIGTEDGMIIHGGKPLHGAVIDSRLDHRLAMSFAIAGLAADGQTEIQRAECVTISYPKFYEDLDSLMK